MAWKTRTSKKNADALKKAVKKDETERETLIAEAAMKGVTFSKRGTMAEIRQEIKEHDEMQRMKDAALAPREKLSARDEETRKNLVIEAKMKGVLLSKRGLSIAEIVQEIDKQDPALATTAARKALRKTKAAKEVAAEKNMVAALQTQEEERARREDATAAEEEAKKPQCRNCLHYRSQECRRYPQELKRPPDYGCGQFRPVPVAPEPPPKGRRGRR